ncbi:MAG TPA: hypothetical protein VFX35_01800 [Solirubrobacterales bacterium]|nr:hypothetical protein [Solirubrobacterales bacterium]
MGIKALLFELIVLGVLLVLALGTWQLVVKRGESPQLGEGKQKQKVRAWKLVLNAVIVAILASAFMSELSDEPAWACVAVSALLALFWTGVVLGVIEDWVSRAEPGEQHKARLRKKKYLKTALSIVVVAVAVSFLSAPAGMGLLVLLLFLHLSHIEKELPSVREPRSLIVPVLVTAAGLSLVVASYLATPPAALDRATVFLEGGGVLSGGYVGQTGEGVFLATCLPRPVNPKVSEKTKMRMVPNAMVRRMVLGGRRYVLDYGKDPSLADAVLYLFKRDSIQEFVPTVSLDLREPKLVCGLRQILVVTDPGKGPSSRLRVWVAGAGTLGLSGSGVRPRRRQVAERGYVTLPLLPKRWVLLKGGNRCRRILSAEVEVQFRLHDGEIKRQSTSVAVALPPSKSPRWPNADVSCARPIGRTNAR